MDYYKLLDRMIFTSLFHFSTNVLRELRVSINKEITLYITHDMQRQYQICQLKSMTFFNQRLPAHYMQLTITIDTNINVTSHSNARPSIGPNQPRGIQPR